MKHTLSFIILFFCCRLLSLGQESLSNKIKGGVDVFGNFSRLEYPDTAYFKNTVFLPGLAAYAEYSLIKNLQLRASAGYFRRGLNAQVPFYKIRSNYIQSGLIIQYWLADIVSFSGGFHFHYLTKQHLLKGTTNNAIGYQAIPINEYQSTLEISLGIGLKITDEISLQLKHFHSLKGKGYNTIQLGINYTIPRMDFDKRGKYHTLEEALANTDDCRILYLKSEFIHRIPPEISRLENLEELYLDWNEISVLPPELFDLKNLKLLSLNRNKLSYIPREIANLQNLEFLYLEYNQIRSLPEEIGLLSNLRFFDIGKNNLESLPESIGNLHNLIELDVAKSGNMLQLPLSISNLLKLEYLFIDPNTLMPIPFSPPNPRLEIIVENEHLETNESKSHRDD